jgi:hypothetical protein
MIGGLILLVALIGGLIGYVAAFLGGWRVALSLVGVFATLSFVSCAGSTGKLSEKTMNAGMLGLAAGLLAVGALVGTGIGVLNRREPY